MKPARSFYVLPYVLSDIFFAVATWWLFTWFRRMSLNEDHASLLSLASDSFFRRSIIIVPLIWLVLYMLTGFYRQPLYLRSRLNELSGTFLISLCGCLLIFFSGILNDNPTRYTYFYQAFGSFFLLHFLLTFSGRLMVLTHAKRRLLSGVYQLNALLVGNGTNALKVYRQIEKNFSATGYTFKGFLATGNNANSLSKYLPNLGNINDLTTAVKKYSIRQVIVALEEKESSLTAYLLQQLSDLDVDVKLSATTIDILSGSVKVSNVRGALLIDISKELMPVWQQNIKRTIDIFFSLTGLLVLSPLLLLLLIKTKTSSPGPVFFAQERIGLRGRHFTIYKFRSMVCDAEKDGPALSSDNDPRITSWGKFLRKWRLDELPQLYNIVKGDMSLVGPRPEREYYIKQIIEINPFYKYLLKVKPGLTSWGMVRFGYASTVSQLIERMKYDLAYVENVSLLLDLKIMIYSIWIIVLGKGK